MSTFPIDCDNNIAACAGALVRTPTNLNRSSTSFRPGAALLRCPGGLGTA
jgi:hypothetical protein